MEYKVSLKQFEGPLDLLLHLIKKEDINIFDISIEEITKQYLEYIENVKDELDVTSEYLIMAATLIEIKAKALLPNKSSEEEEELEDDKNQLIEKLIEYEKYKNLTNTFQQLEEQRKEVYTRDSYELLNFKNNENIDYGINLDDLVNAFQKFLEKKELEKPLKTKIASKEYSINQRCDEIRNIMNNKKQLLFDELFEIKSKENIVVTFLAILTMIKKHEIIVDQKNNFNDIIIKIKE